MYVIVMLEGVGWGDMTSALTALVAMLFGAASSAQTEPARFHLDGNIARVGSVSTKLSLAGGSERSMPGEPRFNAYQMAGEIMIIPPAGPSVPGRMRCIAWDASGSDTNIQGICEVMEGGGDQWSTTYLCNIKDGYEAGGWCWGQIAGTKGRYAGRRGALTWRATGPRMTGEGAWRN